jgi:hypothetical protein
VTEHYGLALSPVLVVNLCAIFCGDSGHDFFSSVRLFVTGTLAEQHCIPILLNARFSAKGVSENLLHG